ncbi:MAG: NUDIX hydrolase [Nocardioidaceae bacterium]
MPTPDFILELRKYVGHAPLWLSGVTAVVFNEAGELLLAQRAETGRWGLVSGILEPGEQPAQAVLREIREETGVEARVERLSSFWAGDPMVIFSNGDQVQFLDLTFRCAYVSGDARAADDENTAVAWFAADALPVLKDTHQRRLEHARAREGSPYFVV